MIDTDDLDRMLRAAFTATVGGDPAVGDPAGRVVARVAHRRHRRVATRIASGVLAIVLAAALIGAMTARKPPRPAHPPAPSVPFPSVFSTPQTAADRAGIPRATNFDIGIVPSSVRLLAARDGVQLFGARDRHGLPCVMLVVSERGGPSADTDCASHPSRVEQRAVAEHFARQGAAEAISGQGNGAIGFFVPDGIKTVVLDGTRYPVVRNGVLIVANRMIDFSSEVRRGSTIRVTSSPVP